LVLAAGGPVLLLPKEPVGEPLGQHALVAWNGSREAARAAHDALPLLVEAESTTLVALGESATTSLDAATAMLARQGVRVTARAEAGSDDVGHRLLRLAYDVGADLLVMGAYGRARLRELVLGGATRDVLSSATIPLPLSS